jgi:hypothetical protein
MWCVSEGLEVFMVGGAVCTGARVEMTCVVGVKVASLVRGVQGPGWGSGVGVSI